MNLTRRRSDNPCYGCSDRYPACSDHCTKPEYIDWKEKQQRIKAAQKAYRSPVWKYPEGRRERRKPPKRERKH